jgi:hypothetical protein
LNDLREKLGLDEEATNNIESTVAKEMAATQEGHA